MKVLLRHFAFILICTSLLAGMAGITPARAASFSVNNAASLIAAINTANINGQPDVITLTADIILTAINNGDNGLPVIGADGGNALTINGNGFSISRSTAGGIPNFRIIQVGLGANLTLNKITISNGYCDGCNGGGIQNGGTLTVTNSTLSGNSANFGSGIQTAGTATITNSTLSNNSANIGGGVFIGNGNLIIANSTLHDNSANYGGGLLSYAVGSHTSTLVFNSTFTGNSASTSGSAILSWASANLTSTSTIMVINSTVVGNNSNSGAAVEVIAGSGDTSTINLENSIVYGNTGSAPNCATSGSSATITGDANNLFPLGEAACPIGASDLTTNAAVNTIVAGLADNGGFTQTRALVAGSPAVDAGDAAICANTPLNGLDQRGVARPQGAACDIGAYEYSSDTTPPTVIATSLVPSYTTGPISFTVTFSEDVFNPSGDTHPEDATNPDNYLIVEAGNNGVFDTLSCVSGLAGDDAQANIASIVYIPNTAIVNLGGSLPSGSYRLFVCGTTSIADLALNPLNGGQSDFTFDFVVESTPPTPTPPTPPPPAPEPSVPVLPATGFTPHRVTSLPPQPPGAVYSALGDIWLEIPSLNVKSPIVGVPQADDNTWDVTWLGNSTGWLNGTAFPTWKGNSVLTAHVYNASGLEGPFAALKSLKHGDQIIVHLFGGQYVYEVRDSRLARPYSTSYAFQSLQDHSHLTLITCQFYNPLNESYLFRRVVRAVLVEVK